MKNKFDNLLWRYILRPLFLRRLYPFFWQKAAPSEKFNILGIEPPICGQYAQVGKIRNYWIISPLNLFYLQMPELFHKKTSPCSMLPWWIDKNGNTFGDFCLRYKVFRENKEEDKRYILGLWNLHKAKTDEIKLIALNEGNDD